MSPELRLHGQISDEIEYYATAAGCRTAHHHFFQVLDDNLRFFAPGNELILSLPGSPRVEPVELSANICSASISPSPT